jgi:hypothetical protein
MYFNLAQNDCTRAFQPNPPVPTHLDGLISQAELNVALSRAQVCAKFCCNAGGPTASALLRLAESHVVFVVIIAAS